MSRLAAGAVAALLAAVIAACGSSPNPSPTTTENGFVEVRLEIAPDATQFFASQHRGRVVGGDGTVLAEWEITDAAAPISVPAGSHLLQAFTVFLSDFIQCSADPAAPGKEHCAAPTLGPGQVCTLPIEVVAGQTVEATYRSLPEGRCELIGRPGPTSSPLGVVPSGPADGVVCAGTGWPPFAVDTSPGVTATSTDRVHLAISNPTSRTWWYRLSGWEEMRFEDCAGLGEVEIERGPVPAGVRLATTFGIMSDRPGIPVTLGLWDRRCGEACTDPPVGGVLVRRSAIEPASS